MKKDNQLLQTNQCKLSFEKISYKLFKNCNWGYYLIGFIIIFSRFFTGVLTIIFEGKWLHENLLISVNTFVLLTVSLIALRYLKDIYYKTINKIIIDEDKINDFLYKKKKDLIRKNIWIIIFLGLVANQFIWLLNELRFMINNPEVIGALPYRGSNLGLIPLVYETFDGLFLYLIFVDLVAIVLAICFLPRDIKSYMKVDELHIDKCGGFSIIGKLMLTSSTTYFIIVAIASIGRFINHPYYYLLVISSIIFGIIIFFLPQYTTHRLIVEEKEQKLKEITDELKKLLGKKSETHEEEFRTSLIRLEKFRLREEIEDIREYPFDTKILYAFLGAAIFPVVTNILTYFIQEII